MDRLEDDHAHWMSEAIKLAREMQGWVWPNPPVGCVIVRNGKIVGGGQTQFGGRPHAERVALDDAGSLSRGAALYVTLEPCCHWGKTPPCADAIIAAGVTAVYASLQDPDPRVNGGGFRMLRDAGIKVKVGLGAEIAQKIMEGFFKRIALGRPLITVSRFVPVAGNVPNGFDGVLTMQEHFRPAVSVRTPSGRAEALALPGGITARSLAEKLGTVGLTSIIIPASDPLSQICRSAGLVDHDVTDEEVAHSSVSRASATTSTSRKSVSAL